MAESDVMHDRGNTAVLKSVSVEGRGQADTGLPPRWAVLTA
jgi:hypothetical protein